MFPQNLSVPTHPPRISATMRRGTLTPAAPAPALGTRPRFLLVKPPREGLILMHTRSLLLTLVQNPVLALGQCPRRCQIIAQLVSYPDWGGGEGCLLLTHFYANIA